MITAKRSLVLPVIAFLFVMFVVQTPFLFSSKISGPSHGVMQPSCTDFTRWVQDPSQYQNNDDMRHGFGLIPAPVDLTPTRNNVTNYIAVEIYCPYKISIIRIFYVAISRTILNQEIRFYRSSLIIPDL